MWQINNLVRRDSWTISSIANVRILLLDWHQVLDRSTQGTTYDLRQLPLNNLRFQQQIQSQQHIDSIEHSSFASYLTSIQTNDWRQSLGTSTIMVSHEPKRPELKPLCNGHCNSGHGPVAGKTRPNADQLNADLQRYGLCMQASKESDPDHPKPMPKLEQKIGTSEKIWNHATITALALVNVMCQYDVVHDCLSAFG